MSLDRTIILAGEGQVELVAAVLARNWRQAAESGHPLAVRIYEHKSSRTLEQQALMWIRLGEIAAQAWVGNRQYSAEVWHEWAKREFLPEDDGPTKLARKGYRKWAVMPSGARTLTGSTTQLTTAGMSEYMEKLMAYGAQELGVQFGATPAEMAAWRFDKGQS